MKNLTLFSLAQIALKHLVLLILVAVLTGIAAFSYCHFIVDPKYTATGHVQVSNGAVFGSVISEDANGNSDSAVQGSDISASRSLVATTIEFLNVETDIYKQLADILDYPSYRTLKSNFSFAQNEENKSIYMKVSYTADSPKDAIEVVNTFLDILPEYATERLDERSKLTPILAETAPKTYPATIRTSFLAAVASAAITYLILLLIYSANTIIQTDDDFKERFDIPLLGCIPDFAQAKSQSSYYYNYGKYGKYARRGKKNDK